MSRTKFTLPNVVGKTKMDITREFLQRQKAAHKTAHDDTSGAGATQSHTPTSGSSSAASSSALPNGTGAGSHSNDNDVSLADIAAYVHALESKLNRTQKEYEILAKELADHQATAVTAVALTSLRTEVIQEREAAILSVKTQYDATLNTLQAAVVAHDTTIQQHHTTIQQHQHLKEEITTDVTTQLSAFQSSIHKGHNTALTSLKQDMQKAIDNGLDHLARETTARNKELEDRVTHAHTTSVAQVKHELHTAIKTQLADYTTRAEHETHRKHVDENAQQSMQEVDNKLVELLLYVFRTNADQAGIIAELELMKDRHIDAKGLINELNTTEIEKAAKVAEEMDLHTNDGKAVSDVLRDMIPSAAGAGASSSHDHSIALTGAATTDEEI